jgi:hypothetical protein
MVGDQGGLPPKEVILDRVQGTHHRKAHLEYFSLERSFLLTT